MSWRPAGGIFKAKSRSPCQHVKRRNVGVRETSHDPRRPVRTRSAVRDAGHGVADRFTCDQFERSKKWENHEAMLGLYFAWYNFVRVHSTIKTTPAVAQGLTDDEWSIEELLDEVAIA